jgi:hypothetical protein
MEAIADDDRWCGVTGGIAVASGHAVYLIEHHCVRTARYQVISFVNFHPWFISPLLKISTFFSFCYFDKSLENSQ